MSRIQELNPMTRQLITALIDEMAILPTVQTELNPAIVNLLKQVRDLTRLKLWEAAIQFDQVALNTI
jgi:hypothetical protein